MLGSHYLDNCFLLVGSQLPRSSHTPLPPRPPPSPELLAPGGKSNKTNLNKPILSELAWCFRRGGASPSTLERRGWIDPAFKGPLGTTDEPAACCFFSVATWFLQFCLSSAPRTCSTFLFSLPILAPSPLIHFTHLEVLRGVSHIIVCGWECKLGL